MIVRAVCFLLLIASLGASAQLTDRYVGKLHRTYGHLRMVNGSLTALGGVGSYIILTNKGYEIPITALLGPLSLAVADIVIGAAFVQKGDYWKAYSDDFPYKGALHKTLGIIDMTVGSALIVGGIAYKAELLVLPGIAYLVAGVLFFERGVQWKQYSISSASNGVSLKYHF